MKIATMIAVLLLLAGCETTRDTMRGPPDWPAWARDAMTPGD